MKIRVIHTGKVYVSVALPFKDAKKNPNPLQLSILSLYGRRNRIWLPVSAYLIEHLNLKILVDTGWHREISPDGEYNRRAQVRHMGIGHFLLNQGVLPEGESVVEQLAALNIASKDLDFVIMTHLHTDHASGLRQLVGAKKILVSEPELDDTRKFPIRYVGSMWKGIKDGGYAKKSWQEMIPPGTALDEAQAFKSLQWIRQMSLDENCVESLANHDPDISPHEIILN